MLKTILTALTVLTILTPSCALAQLDAAVIELETDVDVVRYDRRELDLDRLETIRFLKWESVRFDVTATRNDAAVDLSGDGIFVRWEVYASQGSTNAAIFKAGEVVDASGGQVRVWLEPSEAGLPEGEYYSYLQAFQIVGGATNYVATLAYNRLVVEWAPNFTGHTYSGPYTSDQLDGYATTQSVSAVSGQVSAVSNRVDSLEARSNVWNSVTGKVDEISGSLTQPTIYNAPDNYYAGSVVFRTSQWTNNAFGLFNDNANGSLHFTFADTEPFVDNGSSIFSIGSGGQLTSDGSTSAASDSHLLNVGALDARYAPGSVTGGLAAVSSTVAALEAGTEDFEGLNLNGETITAYGDIGLTYTNAVRLNPAVLVTNDLVWTGWTTTGTLDTNTHVISLMATNEYLLSPVQTNGIASIESDEWSHQNGTLYLRQIWTNGVLAQETAPYLGAEGQVYFRPVSALPGATLGIYVSNVTITAFSDLSEAQQTKEVSSLRVISDPNDVSDVANKRYVDTAKTAAIASASAALTAYAADADKTVRGAQLRLGNMWVVSPADTSGERWICSGGEISGEGELIGTTNEFVISKNDYPLMSFTSGASGLYVTNFNISTTSSNVTASLYIATNGVVSAPFAEWSENLIVGDWSRVSTYDTETYPAVSNSTYELTFTLPLADTMYFRAIQQDGESIATIHVDKFNLNGARLVLTDLANSNSYHVAVSNGTIIVMEE